MTNFSDHPSPSAGLDPESAVKILAVDDSPAVLKLLERTLISIGMQCLTARDGIEALEQLKQGGVSLVITERYDALTGLYNRRGFETKLREETFRAHRQGCLIFLVIIDLDKFKPYNDEFGHPAGDELLRAVSQLLLASTRENVDHCCRHGGDEFAIITARDHPRASADRDSTNPGTTPPIPFWRHHFKYRLCSLHPPPGSILGQRHPRFGGASRSGHVPEQTGRRQPDTLRRLLLKSFRRRPRYSNGDKTARAFISSFPSDVRRTPGDKIICISPTPLVYKRIVFQQV